MSKGKVVVKSRALDRGEHPTKKARYDSNNFSCLEKVAVEGRNNPVENLFKYTSVKEQGE